jgi:hypothetical protein
MNSEDESNDSAETTLGSVMTQREMRILTTLFPKAAQTLACILRNRPHEL